MAIVKDIYQTALVLIFEDPSSTEYDIYLYRYLNILLQQNFDLNNNLRLSKDLTALELAQTVSTKNDTLTYEVEMTTEILPLGLAAMLIKEDDMMATGGKIYRDIMEQYKESQQRNKKYFVTDIVDEYGGDYYE